MNEASQLALLDRVEHLLAEATTVTEVKEVRDKAEALRHYARNARLGLELQNQAAEAKLRAERKAGEMLQRLALNGGDRRSELHAARVKLADLGIERTQSHRWQRIAAISTEVFEDYLRFANATGKEVSATALLRWSKSHVEPMGPRDSVNSSFRQHRVDRTPHEYDDNQARFAELAAHCSVMAGIVAPFAAQKPGDITVAEKRHLASLVRQACSLLEELRPSMTTGAPFGPEPFADAELTRRT